jgi:hypothetical protein
MAVLIVRAVNETNDFTSFYAAAKAWRVGYPEPNHGPLDLNPPTFSVLLAPLTFLSLNGARVVWTLVSVFAFADALRLIRYRSRIGIRTMLWLTAGCVGLEPAVFAWALGQVTWILMWIVTRAWLSADASPARAGVWLGLAVAIKPPLVLMAIMLSPAIWIAAGLVAACVTGAAMAITGWPVWQSWLALNGQVDWLAWWPNASLWGVAARIHAGGLGSVTLKSLPLTSVISVLLASAALAVVTLRSSGHRRWLLAGLWYTAASPLGWTYYLPLFLGPAVVTPVERRVPLMLALAILAAPVGVFTFVTNPIWIVVICGSIYSVALALLWWAWTPRHGHGF